MADMETKTKIKDIRITPWQATAWIGYGHHPPEQINRVGTLVPERRKGTWNAVSQV